MEAPLSATTRFASARGPRRTACLLFLCGLFTLACAGSATPVSEESDRIGPDAQEHARNVEALRPPKRERPLVAVLANNSGTETTDFLVPYGVLAESDLAEVVAVAPESGRVELMPALAIFPDETLSNFDTLHPNGADYVVVPAMHDRSDPRIHAWVRAQADSGAIIVAICSGAMVLSDAGLLGGHSVTTHWFDFDTLGEENPDAELVSNRRYVIDRGIVTTTGVTASIPVSLLLVEAIGGWDAAHTLAKRIGAPDWSSAHDSSAFELQWRSVTLALGNWLAVWSHERVGIEVATGVDEIALALSADAYSRTFRSKTVSLSRSPTAIETRNGLRLIPDVSSVVDFGANADRMLEPKLLRASARALDGTLQDIQCRYGPRDAAFVALQLEYSQANLDRPSSGAGPPDPDC